MAKLMSGNKKNQKQDIDADSTLEDSNHLRQPQMRNFASGFGSGLRNNSGMSGHRSLGDDNNHKKQKASDNLNNNDHPEKADKLGKDNKNFFDNNRGAQNLSLGNNDDAQDSPSLSGGLGLNKLGGGNDDVKPKSDDIAAQRLAQSQADKTRKTGNLAAGNLSNAIENNGGAKKEASGDSSTEENNDSSDKSDDPDDNQGFSEKERARIRKMKRFIRVAGFVLFAFGFYALIMTVASALTGGGVFKVAPVSSIKDYGTDDFHAVTDEDSPAHQDELDYYEQLKTAAEENIDVDINYVSAILLSVFVNEKGPDPETLTEEEYQKLQDSAGIDFARMSKNIDAFAEVISDAQSDDYEINGVVYNAIKRSSAFKEYYKDALKERTADEILEDVFRLAMEIKEEQEADEMALTSETSVTVSSPTTSSTSITPKPTTSASTMSMKEYISGSIYANTNKVPSSEAIKAYTVAYSTNIVAENKKLTINSNNASASNLVCSIKDGCSYDKEGNLVSGSGERNSKNDSYYNGQYYYKIPLSNDEQTAINKSVDSVYGKVLVNSDGTYPTLDLSVLGGFGDGNYENELKDAYGNLSFKDVGEDSYVSDDGFGTRKVQTPVIFYDQTDYSNQQFCGLNKYTIGGSGCGVTAMAMVVSTYENNKKYDPIYMNKEAKRLGKCSRDGTAQAFFDTEANVMKYRHTSGTKYNKKLLKSVLEHLSAGHLVVVRIGSGHFTSGGHYMVLGGVDPETKSVYVYDPNNRSNKNNRNRRTGNGWYSYNNIIVKEAYNFYIIWKG